MVWAQVLPESALADRPCRHLAILQAQDVRAHLRNSHAATGDGSRRRLTAILKQGRYSMMHFSAILLATGLLASPGAAIQQEHVALEQVRTFPADRQAIVRAYQGYESGLSTHCDKIDRDDATRQVHVVVPLKLDAKGDILSGIWTEKTMGTACGEKRGYSALAIFDQNGPHLYSLWPGESNSSRVLQHDAMTTVSAAIAVAGGTCPVDVVNSAPPHGMPEVDGAPWEERWTAQSCEKRFLVTVHFLPDKTGTGFSLKPKYVVPLPAT